jgi:Gpi18-like mannosyltransferase
MLIKKYKNDLIIIISILTAFLLRLSLIPFRSLDFTGFLEPWYNFIINHGGFKALQYNFANYNPPYLYLMVLASYLFSGFSNIFAIKSISITFDFISAFLVYKIVRLKYPQSKIPIYAAIAFLFAPTVFINSAFWGQCDVIYTTGLLACIYYVLIKRELLAFVCFGLAFSFKQQAIFLIPLLLILAFKKIVSWKSFLVIPAIYLLTLVPAWLAGRPLKELLLIYFAQANTYQDLSKNAPNIYMWLPDSLYHIFVPIGLIFTAFLIFIFSLAIYKSKVKLEQDIIIYISLISTLLMPYFLPKMHERYFFVADAVSLIFAFYFPKYFYIPIVIILSSLFSYTPFLFDKPIVSLYVLSLVLFTILIILLVHFNRIIHEQKAAIVKKSVLQRL